jgi:uncharacterized protein (DUF433 family)
MAAETLSPSVSPPAPAEPWRYLEERPHPWRRQLSVKGRRLRAFSVWSDMIANGLSVEEVAQSRELSVEAVRECVRYCEENQPLLQSECEREKRWLLARGVRLDPPPSR